MGVGKPLSPADVSRKAGITISGEASGGWWRRRRADQRDRGREMSGRAQPTSLNHRRPLINECRYLVIRYRAVCCWKTSVYSYP